MACGRVASGIRSFPRQRQFASGPRLAPAQATRRRKLLLILSIIAARRSPAPRAAMADPIKANVTAGVSGGYARLVFSMSDYDAASVRQEGTVLVISFKDPVDVSVDRLATQAPDYIGAARRDPDGKAVRLALARKVTVNAMTCGRAVLRRPVARQLAADCRRACRRTSSRIWRAAPAKPKKLAARERRLAALGKIPPVRVHVATEPTFTRYIFGVPDQISVAADARKERAHAHLRCAAQVRSRRCRGGAAARGRRDQDADCSDGSASVHFDLLAKVNVRTFRDENGYAVDIVGAESQAPCASRCGAFSGPAPQGSDAPQAAPPTRRTRNRRRQRRRRAETANGSSCGSAGDNAENRAAAAPPTIAAPAAAGATGRADAARFAAGTKRLPQHRRCAKPTSLAQPRRSLSPASAGRAARAASPAAKPAAAVKPATAPNAAPLQNGETARKNSGRACPPRRELETVVRLHGAHGGCGLQPCRHAVARVRLREPTSISARSRTKRAAPSAAPN